VVNSQSFPPLVNEAFVKDAVVDEWSATNSDPAVLYFSHVVGIIVTRESLSDRPAWFVLTRHGLSLVGVALVTTAGICGDIKGSIKQRRV
jgi:hypothetical protein